MQHACSGARLKARGVPLFVPFLLSLPSLAVAQVLPFFPAVTLNDAIPQRQGQQAAATAEQEQRARQQQEARERAQAVHAPGVRAQDVAPVEYPPLPSETPCFRIDRFVLEVPADLPAHAQVRGASALPQDPFAFARAWLDHYQGTASARAAWIC
ncbi:hypothetical protein D3C81_1270990 [compost metagenome]